MTTDMQWVLGGLRPTGHRIHRVPSTGLVAACPSCLGERQARQGLAALLRPFNDGWGALDFELLLPELAMALDPQFGAPQIIQEIFPTEL